MYYAIGDRPARTLILPNGAMGDQKQFLGSPFFSTAASCTLPLPLLTYLDY
jgi:hypothetical protein